MSHDRGLLSKLWANAFSSLRCKVASRRPWHSRLQLENLEDRIVPAVIGVTTTADGTGAGTLRAAIAQADTNDANGDTNNTIDITVAGTYDIGPMGALAIFSNAVATQSGQRLTIQNTSGGNVTISGDNVSRVFDINPNDIIPANNASLGSVTIDNVLIEDGMAQASSGDAGNGGGIRDQGPVDLTLNNDALSRNSAAGNGGGFADQNNMGKLLVQNSLIDFNSASGNGGGIQEGNGLTVINSEIDYNSAVNGGGLDVNGGTLTLTGSTLQSNHATGNGGGIELQTTAASTISNSTIAGNGAPTQNGTSTTNNGGGIDDDATGAVALADDTIISNSARNGGGLFFAGSTGLTVQNTIFDNTIGGAGSDYDFTNGGISGVDQGGNVVGVNDANVFNASTTQSGTAANPLNSQVRAPDNNGGPVAGSSGYHRTVETGKLEPSSPAIGKGVPNSITADQRGLPRATPPDVGAFQYQNVTLVVNIQAPASVEVNGNANFTVTVTNTSRKALPAENGYLTVGSDMYFQGSYLDDPPVMNHGFPYYYASFPLGPLGAGQSVSYNLTDTPGELGTQYIEATVTAPDSNPTTVTNSVTVNVTNTPPPIPLPQGTLTLFALGFGPTGLDVFEFDAQGDIFAQGIQFTGLTGTPTFLGTGLSFPALVYQNDMLYGLLNIGGQNYLADIFNVFNPLVESALSAYLHI